MKNSKTTSDKKDEAQVDCGGALLGGLTGLLGSLGKLTEAAERLSHRKTESSASGTEETAGSADKKTTGEKSAGGILNGLADLARKLEEVSEKGGTVSENGNFNFSSKDGGGKAVYGFTIKTGLGDKGDDIRVEPFGNVRKDKATGEVVVQEISEPLVDVFEEADATTLVAEMPGVGPDDIQIEVQDDVLTISAKKGEKKYRKEMLLGHLLSKERLQVTCNNGIVTIRCGKAG